jgi:hypothetical protein
MQLILAIDSDPRRSEQLANLVRARLAVDLVQATSAGEGLHALRDRVPDLILTSPLLSPFDDGVLDEYLRDLGAAATHVQTVRIPMLSTGPRKKSAATRLFSLGRKKKQTSSAAPDGCDPKIFADEIAHYLTRSLEDRTASASTTTDRPERKTDRAAWAVDDWGAPAALVEEFRAPVDQTPEPTYAAPVLEETHVPGSILDLRTPVQARKAVKPEPPIEPEPTHIEPEPAYEPTYVAPQPTYVTPEPTYVMPEPAYGMPEPTYAMPEPRYVAPEPSYVTPEPSYVTREPSYAKAEPLIEREPTYFTPEPTYEPVVEPKPTASTPEGSRTPALPTVSTPAPATTPASTSGNSASFEAALAAIRAAWAKPESTASKPAPKQTAPAEPARPAGTARPLAGSGEVDLTNALDDVGGVDSTNPADDDNSPDGSTTPNGHRKAEKPKKRPEKPRARRMHGPGDKDDWGAFDPNTCEFSTLVNKLDEVTDSDEPTPTTTRSTTVR